ncbi:MAG: serine/threonine protein kinase [Methylomonas sp.]|nr:MAG: serine/threonine protein kinase [Methylomonas sp.]
MGHNTAIPNPPLKDDELTVLRPDPSGNVSSQLPPAASRLTQFPVHLTILDMLDQGGIGRVHLAYDETIGRRVALKELRDEYTQPNASNAEVINTFIHEAKITGKLEHPGIIPVYELGHRNDGSPYYVMRYVKGETLEQSLKKCIASETQSAFARRLKLLDILIAVCDTLAYAHSKGVIHRDLKPANIISGGFGETIVLDWGLAQAVEDSDNTYFYREVLTHQRHTLSDLSTSEVMGTPAYMAPEQFNGSAGKTSDVYSLGVILFRILSGTLPYRGSLEDIQSQIESPAASPSPKSINPAAQVELVAICEKAMHKNPVERFADAGELALQLKAFREGRIVNIYAYSRQELLRRFLSQNKAMLVMLSLLMLTVLGGAGFSWYYAKQMEQAKAEAEDSLVILTAFGERSQQQARAIANSLSAASTRLFSDLNRLSSQIDAKNPDANQLLLSQLHSQYPKFESFTLRNASEISTIFSKDGDDNAQHVLRPIAQIENNRLVLIYRVPVQTNNQVDNYLEARMFPEQVLPDFLPLNTLSDTHRRNIWIMRKDGLIIYDESPEYIATNLFTDEINYRSASLQAFGRLMLIDEDSIGYYSLPEADKETYKIAAWDSITFSPEHSWKIVVSYTYMQKSASAKF